MQTLYSLMAMPAWLTENAKGIAIAAVAVVALMAFIVGAVKGFTRLGWGALIWAGSCALFYALETKCHDANPLLKIGAVAKLDPGVQSFASTLSIALLSILAALAVFGVVALVFRPKKRRKAAIKHIDEDEDEDIEDVEEEEERGGARRGICAFNRVIGGLTAVVNAVLVLAAIACTALLIFNVTPLRYGSLQSVYENGFVEKVWDFVQKYTLDFLFVAVMAAVGYGGYRTGIIGGFRSVFLTLGYIAAVGLAFYLPFSKVAANKEWLSFIGKLSDYFGALIGKALPESVAGVLGKVACGLVLCIGFCIVVALLGLLLKLLAKAVKRVPVLRFVDGILSTIVMLALGAIICALIAALLYILEHFGVFESSSLFESSSPLMRGLYDTFDEYLRPLLEKLSSTLG